MEDHFTKIPNKAIDALASRKLRGEAVQIILMIIKKTYGFRKDSDAISLSQFSEKTGIKKPNVAKLLKYLIDLNIIIRDNTQRISTYKLNPNFEEWKCIENKRNTIKEESTIVSNSILSTNASGSMLLDNEIVCNSITGSMQLDNKAVSNSIHTKERKKLLQKKLLQKTVSELDQIAPIVSKKTPDFLPDSFEIKASKFLYEKCKEKNPFIKEPNFQKWAKEIDLMKRIDGIEESYIMRMIEWAKGNERFWARNILSTASLKKHFASMYEEARSEYENRKVYKL